MGDLNSFEGIDIADEARAVQWPLGDTGGAVAEPQKFLSMIHYGLDDIRGTGGDFYLLIGETPPSSPTMVSVSSSLMSSSAC